MNSAKYSPRASILKDPMVPYSNLSILASSWDTPQFGALYNRTDTLSRPRFIGLQTATGGIIFRWMSVSSSNSQRAQRRSSSDRGTAVLRCFAANLGAFGVDYCFVMFEITSSTRTKPSYFSYPFHNPGTRHRRCNQASATGAVNFRAPRPIPESLFTS